MSIKDKAFDEVKELYFEYDWQSNTPLDFITELGMILTKATIELDKGE